MLLYFLGVLTISPCILYMYSKPKPNLVQPPISYFIMDMKCSLENGDCSRNTQSRKRQLTHSEKSLDFDDLDCPICYEPLTIPTFQCDNGHVACQFCWPRLKKKCPACRIPIGNKRCREMETVLKSVLVPCPNSKLGCNEIVPYGRESAHEKESCRFSLCSCPEIEDCQRTDLDSGIFFHYLSCHPLKDDCFFRFGVLRDVKMPINDKTMVLITLDKTLLFVVQCFREADGVYVAVYCIAPLAPEVEKFSYLISYSFDGHTRSHEMPEMKRILKVSFQTPQDKNDLMFVPNRLLLGKVLRMKLCISRT